MNIFSYSLFSIFYVEFCLEKKMDAIVAGVSQIKRNKVLQNKNKLNKEGRKGTCGFKFELFLVNLIVYYIFALK